MGNRTFDDVLASLAKWVLENTDTLLEAAKGQLAHMGEEAPRAATSVAGADAIGNACSFIRARMKQLLEAEIEAYKLDPSRARFFLEDAYWQNSSTLMLVVMAWLVVEGLQGRISLERVLEAALTGIMGYRILDLHFDAELATQAEVMMGIGLIAKEEHLLLDQFGYSAENISILQQSRNTTLIAEAREKRQRWPTCPVSDDAPIELGEKAAMVIPLFALPLQLCGREADIPRYRDLILKISAGVQILDDTCDVAEDLSHGYFTLISRGYEDIALEAGPEAAAARIMGDGQRLREVYSIAVRLLREASRDARELDDAVLGFASQYYLHRVHTSFSARGGTYAWGRGERKAQRGVRSAGGNSGETE